jgi:hypothetical protein
MYVVITFDPKHELDFYIIVVVEYKEWTEGGNILIITSTYSYIAYLNMLCNNNNFLS